MIEHVFPRMGTTVRVLLPDEDSVMVDFVTARMLHLETLWSRFIESSDISALAQANGRSVPVADETITLVEHLVNAYIATDGLFDPTILPSLIAAGYSKSRVDDLASISVAPEFAGTVEDIEIDARANEITLPAGMSLDAGGLGKGLAADLVTQDLLDMGVQGASLSVGGDVALVGTPDDGENWVVNIGAPHNYDEVIATVRVRGGGVATSTLAARTWDINGQHRHHVIDPRTRKPVAITPGSTLQATVIAGSAAWAEAFATALTVCDAGTAASLVARHNLAALLVLHDGSMHELGTWAGFH